MAIERVLLAGLMVLAVGQLGGCVNRGPKGPPIMPATDFTPAPFVQPIAFAPGSKTKSIELTALDIALPEGTVLGAVEAGTICRPVGTSTAGKSVPLTPQSPWAKEFFSEGRMANYNVIGDPENPFEDKAALNPNLKVAAQIVAWKKNTCYPNGVVNLASQQHNDEENIDVEWKVYDTAKKQIVLTVRTHGYGQGSMTGPAASSAFTDNVRGNVRGLLANEEFHNLVASK